MRLLASVFLTAFGTCVVAECGPGQDLFLSCTFYNGAKSVEVCAGIKTSTYSFGPTGGVPELQLSEPTATLRYAPWNGVGREIYEVVTFHNGAVDYEVFGSRDRPVSEDEINRTNAGIFVSEHTMQLADLVCDPESIVFTWTERLSEGKAAAGLCYDHAAFDWLPCANKP